MQYTDKSQLTESGGSARKYQTQWLIQRGEGKLPTSNTRYDNVVSYLNDSLEMTNKQWVLIWRI